MRSHALAFVTAPLSAEQLRDVESARSRRAPEMVMRREVERGGEWREMDELADRERSAMRAAGAGSDESDGDGAPPLKRA